MELTEIMRQTEEEKEFRHLLENNRIGYPSENDKDILLSLHLNSGNFTPKQKEYILSYIIHFFRQTNRMTSNTTGIKKKRYILQKIQLQEYKIRQHLKM